MPIPRRLDADQCGLLTPPWSLDPTLASMLVRLEDTAHRAFSNLNLPWPGIRIISGHRTPDANKAARGVPQSLHLLCPSLAADLRFGNTGIDLSEEQFWQWLGAHWLTMGGRWGGNFSKPDVNHFDLGVGV